ncbi:MAG: CRTAC1 family protein [Bacteroidetes bacterium]|nr:CRTAC1 family protein [Bacteroidota bacterium]
MKHLFLLITVVLVTFISTGFSENQVHKYLNGNIFVDVTKGSGFQHYGQGKIVLFDDYDRDGDLDIYISVVYAPDKFFMNIGDLKFVNISAETGIINPHDGHGAVFADFDRNGYKDLFIANNLEYETNRRKNICGPNKLFMLDDEGVFNEKALDAGVAGNGINQSCGVTTADINSDGYLDMFVAVERFNDRGDDCANHLYLNNGNGTFKDIAAQTGVDDRGYGYTCNFVDYDNDGDADLFVGNETDAETQPARILYRNDGNLKFTDVSKEAGIAGSGCSTCSVWLDMDNDGDLDLFVGQSITGDPARTFEFHATNLNKLFKNNGDGTFTDVSKQAGVEIDTKSRGCVAGDIDNDGDIDIYVTNSGSESLVLLNDGKGKFTESKKVTGGSVFYGHGCGLGDLDGDGDLDLGVGNWRRIQYKNSGEWKLFKNKTDNKNWLKIDLKGTKSNPEAVMSKVWVYSAGHAKDNKYLNGYHEVTAGNGVFTGNPLQQHFGLNADKKYDVVVKFPSGIEVIKHNVSTAQTLSLVEPEN